MQLSSLRSRLNIALRSQAVCRYRMTAARMSWQLRHQPTWASIPKGCLLKRKVCFPWAPMKPCTSG